MSLKRERDEDDHEEGDPYAAAERPGRWVLVWREVVVERGDDVREEALDDDQVTVFVFVFSIALWTRSKSRRRRGRLRT